MPGCLVLIESWKSCLVLARGMNGHATHILKLMENKCWGHFNIKFKRDYKLFASEWEWLKKIRCLA